MRPNDTEKVHNLPKKMYLDYVKLFPVSRVEGVKSYLMLILTLLAIIGFSVFAIEPTIRTIIELRKKLEDSRFAEKALTDKISALSSLQEQYSLLGSDLIILSEAIPNDPDAPSLLGKIRTLADSSGVRVIRLETSSVELTKKSARSKKPSSFVFTIVISGTYPQTIAFLESLSESDRIITLDTISLNAGNRSTEPLTTSIRARAYFHPESL